MTGFGSAGRLWEGSGVRIDVEIRSVNARFLEPRIRQPFGLAVEQQVRARIEKGIGRGRVDAAIFLRRGGSDQASDPLAPFGVTSPQIVQALEACGSIADLGARQGLEMSPGNCVALLRLLSLRSAPVATDPPAAAPPFLLELIDEAIDQLRSFRRREGQALERCLRGHAAELREHVAALRERLPEENEALHGRVRERIAELVPSSEMAIDMGRLEQEIAIVAARSDISEELDRLGSHLDQIDEHLDAKPKVGQGKTLDFLAQELLREIATIGSKISGHLGRRTVIDAKSTIERIREQVQNVE
jgi:uncharacterized protein (TIGR00255 family)